MIPSSPCCCHLKRWQRSKSRGPYIAWVGDDQYNGKNSPVQVDFLAPVTIRSLFLAAAAKPLIAVGAHRVNQRRQRLPLLGERIFDARRHLGVGLAANDP